MMSDRAQPMLHARSRAGLRHPSQRGVTLLELMVALAILALVLGLGVPAFDNITLSTTLRSYSNSLVASAQLARGEAMKRNGVVRMCVSADGVNCTTGDWQQGWIVYVEADGTVLHQQQALDTRYVVNSSADDIDFQPSGVGAAQANLTVCRSSPSAGSEERLVSISATGRTSVTKTETGSCP